MKKLDLQLFANEGIYGEWVLKQDLNYETLLAIMKENGITDSGGPGGMMAGFAFEDANSITYNETHYSTFMFSVYENIGAVIQLFDNDTENSEILFAEMLESPEENVPVSEISIEVIDNGSVPEVAPDLSTVEKILNEVTKPPFVGTRTPVILSKSVETPNDEIYPATRTDLLLNKKYANPFVAKTNEDKKVAIDEKGNLLYKGDKFGLEIIDADILGVWKLPYFLTTGGPDVLITSDIKFKSNNKTYCYIEINIFQLWGRSTAEIKYGIDHSNWNYDIAYNEDNGGWQEEAYKTIEIIDVKSLTNKQKLLTWLKENANKKSTPKPTSETKKITLTRDYGKTKSYPSTTTDIIYNNNFEKPFVFKTSEDSKVAIDENGDLWYHYNNVIANPSLSGGEPELTGLQVGGNKYKIENGGELVTEIEQTSVFRFQCYNDYPEQKTASVSYNSISGELLIYWGDGYKSVIKSTDSIKTITHLYSEFNKPIKMVVVGCFSEITLPLTIKNAEIGYNNMESFRDLFLEKDQMQTISFNIKQRTSNCQNMFSNDVQLLRISNFSNSNYFDATSMFFGCSKLETIENCDFSNAVKCHGMFMNCSSIISLPILNISKATDTTDMFNSCDKLTHISFIDIANSTNARNMFYNCKNLQYIYIVNINTDISFENCIKMQQPILHSIIDNLVPQTSGTRKTLTLGDTLLARVSEEYKQKANNKGWNLV